MAARQQWSLHARLVDELGRRVVADPELTLSPDEIGAEFGVSRTVVRETLRVLEAKGLVSARPNVGTRVRPRTDWNLFDPQVIDWRLHGPRRAEQMRELLELRGGIEPMAAALAAERATPADVTALREAWSGMRDAVAAHDLSAFSAADIALHTALLAAVDNPMIAQLSGVVAEVVRAREEMLRRPEHINPDAVARHGDLVEAVAGHDPAAASSAMRAVLAEVTHAVTTSAPDRR